AAPSRPAACAAAARGQAARHHRPAAAAHEAELRSAGVRRGAIRRTGQRSGGGMMREFLDDAYAHREDGYGRAQKHARRQLPKRFDSEASYAGDGDAFVVTLDGRPTRTPGRVPVRVPAEAVAARLAEEWGAQGDEIDPDTMPHVRLVNSAVEGGEAS